MIRVAVITVSDRASRGEYRDRSGPLIEQMLKDAGFNGLVVRRQVVPDEAAQLRDAFKDHLDKDFIITTGGTGLSPRDITPEVTRSFCDRPVPGIGEMLRRESCRETPYAVLSRGYAGMKGNTLIINLPGSVKGVRFCTRLLIPLLSHARIMAEGKGH